MFPRRVPSLNTHLTIHENGLTDPQMVALQASVNLMRPYKIDHCRRINVILYEKYPQFLKLFRRTPRDNYNLHAHSEHVMNFFSDLIERGLGNLDLYKQMLSEFVKRHRKFDLDPVDIENMLSVYEEYMNAALARHMSTTMHEAISLFYAAISAAFREDFEST